MAVLKYPTETSLPGPWLIDAGQLKELDGVLDSFKDRLSQEKNRLIEEKTDTQLRENVGYGYVNPGEEEAHRPALRERVAARVRNDQRYVTIYLSQGKSVQANSFAEAINLHSAAAEIPLGLRCFVRVGEIEATISLAGTWNEDLTIAVQPDSSDLGQQLFGALRNWASNAQGGYLPRIWLNWRGSFRFLLYMWAFMGFWSSFIVIELNTKSALKQEARELLKEGVTKENEQKAIRLLLAISSDFKPENTETGPSRRYWAYYAAGILILGLLSICPKISLGFWKGKNRQTVWRLWVNAVTVFVPTLLFSSVLWPRFLTWLGL